MAGWNLCRWRWVGYRTMWGPNDLDVRKQRLTRRLTAASRRLVWRDRILGVLFAVAGSIGISYFLWIVAHCYAAASYAR